MLRRALIGTALLAAGIFAGAAQARAGEEAKPLRFDNVYGDHMVLQRDREIRVAGYARPNAEVEVSLAGESVKVKAGENGRWTAELPAMPAGGPHSLVAVAEGDGQGGNAKIECTDVLIGEVWIASGQSNMEFRVRGGQFARVVNADEEVAAADHPRIRLFNSSSRKYVSPGELRDQAVGPGWQVCSPETVANFSAIGYFFAREIQKELDVPVGVISAAWGGTRIEPWISAEGFRAAGREKETLQIEGLGTNDEVRKARLAEAIKKAREVYDKWIGKFNAFDPDATREAADWKNPGFDDDAWTALADPSNSFPVDVDGVAWYRKTVEIPADWAGKDLKLQLGAIDDCDETYFNGEKVGSTGPDVANHWSVARAYTVPGALVKAGKNVVAVRVSDFYGDGGLMGKAEARFLAPTDKADAENRVSLGRDWRMKMEYAVNLGKIGPRPNPEGAMPGNVKSPSFPATLYNSMIHPWRGYPLRGALWYQGESNAGDPQDYFDLHKLLINDWRRVWNDPELAFLFVQLAAFERHQPANRLADGFWKDRAPSDPNWARLRESQAATLKAMPHTGMAVTMDVGDHSDIHPADKQTVGYRLAREALRVVYGKDIVSAGPYFESLAIDGDKAVVRFANIGQGLVAKGGEPLGGFAVAGGDGKFVWAEAEIDGDTVVVRSPEVKEPKHVRYGWVSYAENLNLFNKDGFPASPFRSDTPDYLK